MRGERFSNFDLLKGEIPEYIPQTLAAIIHQARDWVLVGKATPEETVELALAVERDFKHLEATIEKGGVHRNYNSIHELRNRTILGTGNFDSGRFNVQHTNLTKFAAFSLLQIADLVNAVESPNTAKLSSADLAREIAKFSSLATEALCNARDLAGFDVLDFVSEMHEEKLEELREEIEPKANEKAKAIISDNSRKALSARHSRTRELKREAFRWCKTNFDRFGTIERATKALKSDNPNFSKVAHRTLRDWVSDYKKIASE